MILYIMFLFFYCFWRTLGCFACHDAIIIIHIHYRIYQLM